MLGQRVTGRTPYGALLEYLLINKRHCSKKAHSHGERDSSRNQYRSADHGKTNSGNGTNPDARSTKYGCSFDAAAYLLNLNLTKFFQGALQTLKDRGSTDLTIKARLLCCLTMQHGVASALYLNFARIPLQSILSLTPYCATHSAFA